MRGLLPFAFLLLGACRVVVTETPASETPVVRTAQPARIWSVVDGEQRVGSVVLFRSAAKGAFFSVRNAWQQDLGLVDELGRAWVYRPHEDGAEWLGAGTVAEGAARILGVEGCELVETSLVAPRGAALPAVANPRAN